MNEKLLEIQNAIRSIRAELSSVSKQITVLCATKMVSTDEILFAVNECGIDHIGENRVNELLQKYEVLSPYRKTGLQIHLIGTLQKNKVKYIADKVDMIHSVDSLSLAEEIEKQCGKINKVMDVLIEVNSASETSKGGVAFEEIFPLAEQIASLPHLCLRGLMTMGAPGSEEEYHKAFRQTHQIYEKLVEKFSITNPVLSMGMSDSYLYAAEDGATLVRIGSAIFGKRQYQ